MTSTYERCLEASRSHTDTRSPEQRALAANAAEVSGPINRMCRYTADPRWAQNATTVQLISDMETELSRKLSAVRLDAPALVKSERA
jgi:hypothetical protein